MKSLIFTTLSFIMLATTAYAQQGGSVSAEQIANILNQAKQHDGRVKINTTTIMAAFAMHGCLKEKIGDEGIKRLGDWGTQLNKQVKPLCAEGKRDEAKALQMRYAASVMKTPEYAGVKSCTTEYKDMLSDPMFTEIRAVVENPSATDKHICDYQQKPSAYSAQTK